MEPSASISGVDLLRILTGAQVIQLLAFLVWGGKIMRMLGKILHQHDLMWKYFEQRILGEATHGKSAGN